MKLITTLIINYILLLKENTSSLWEIILGFIVTSIAAYLLFSYPLTWLYAFISKITNSNINYRGKNLTNPDDFDLMVKHSKNQINKFKEKVSTLNTNSKSTIGKIEKN